MLKHIRFILLLLVSLCLISPLAVAQGTIFGAVRNSDTSVPDSNSLSFFGFIGNSDFEIRTRQSIGAGYDAGNWFDDFQNYLSEAPGLPYDYYYFNSANSEMFHLNSVIPSNSFQQEDVVLQPASWPTVTGPIVTIPIIDSGIVIRWPLQTGITMHVYRRQGSSEGSFFRIDDPSGNLANKGVVDSFFVDTQVDRVSNYSYVLIAEDGSGAYSPPSIVFLENSACVAVGATDSDGDFIADLCDNCPDIPNPLQIDENQNSIGDICEGGCCQIRGNVNGLIDVGSPIAVVDLTYLIAFLFQGGPAPPCEEEGNVDSLSDFGGPINISDLTYLVAYLFQGGPLPPACQ